MIVHSGRKRLGSLCCRMENGSLWASNDLEVSGTSISFVHPPAGRGRAGPALLTGESR